MKSYGDLDDECNGQGCLQPLMVVIVVLAVSILLLPGCQTKNQDCDRTTCRKCDDFDYIVRKLSEQ